MLKTILVAGAVIAAISGVASQALAGDGREAQLVGFHALCNRGDKPACVRFGMMLQQNADHHAEWRRTHPEFFFFER